jgi:TonB family protein
MTDSSARAQRFDTASSPSPVYLWTPAGKEVAVSIPLATIDGLEREAVESFRSLTSRGSEIGGLLFGSVVAGSPLTIAIETYQAVECDYNGGPLYRLADAERARLDRAIERQLSAGIKAVGFYRSHTRKGLCLDADDLALFESRFIEPHHIALLIRPAATKVSTAGIFIREGGKINGEASCLEFPFRSSQHDLNRRSDSMYDGAVAGPRSVTASPASPRPVIRAQIVPIASRREIPVEASLPPVVQAAPDAPEPVAIPAPQAAPPAPEPKPAPEAAPPPAAAIESAPEPARPLEELEQAEKPRSAKTLWVSVGAAASLLLLVGFLFSSGVLHRGASTPGAAQDASPLALRVDRNGGDIVLTWNRESDPIKAASRAVLSISDGAQHENVELDLPQLRNGSIVYAPVTSDVVFRMEVIGGNSKTTSESVRVLRTRPSPLGEPEQAQTPATPAVPPKPESAATATGADLPAGAAPVDDQKVALAQAVRPFRAESLAQRLRATPSTDMPDTPAIGVPAASSNVNLGNLISTQAAPLPPPSAPAAAPAIEKKNVGGQIQQAVILKRVDPQYPRLALNSGAGGVVELMATIGPNGRVKAVQVIKGHPLLRQAAIDAVKQWVYQPTVLNGVPVEAQTQVFLNFRAVR